MIRTKTVEALSRHTGFRGNAMYLVTAKAGDLSKVSFISGQNRQELRSGELHTLYRVGRWLIETVFPDSSNSRPSVNILLAHNAPSDDAVSIQFGGPSTIRIFPLGPSGVERNNDIYERVTAIEILPGHAVRVSEDEVDAPPLATSVPDNAASISSSQTTGGSQGSAGSTGQTTPVEGQNGGGGREPRPSQQEISALRGRAEKAEKENAELSRENARLNGIASARLDDLLAQLHENQSVLRRNLQEKIAEAEDAERVNENLRERRHKVEEDLDRRQAETRDIERELDRIRRDLDQAAAAEEALNVDCQQVRRELDSLRERLADDRDTLDLMGQEPFLNGKTLRKSLDAAERELDSAEKRLGLIITLRESINSHVQNTIVAGDGTIPLTEELRGKHHA